jgi:serine/threonine-protein kinase
VEQAGSVARMMCPACNGRYDGGQFCAKDGTPLVKDLSAGKADLVGTVLADRYRIVRLLGEGGMGQVYEAQHVNINKRFAIKLLRPEIVSNPEAVQRFRQEAWSASSIGHDNIIEIDDFATLPSGSVYLAMEFLAGQSLADSMRGGKPIEIGEALDIFLQVSSGLAAAHEKNIIHRDMKPENIFLSQKHGRTVVKILDFGIAKVSGAEGSHSLTRTGAIFGTPHYMSPEQALGKPLDHRSDVYSVGVIMYEVFTGRVPFEAESFMGILTKHITTEPRRPTEAAPDRQIPPEVEAVILRAMAKDSNDRYASMVELGNDVLAVMQMYAPHRLSPSGNQVVIAPRTLSAPMAAQRPVAPTMLAPGASGTMRKVQPTPSGLQRAPSQGFAAASESLDAVPYANPEPEEKKKRPIGLLIGGAAVLLVGGVAVGLVVSKKPADPPKAAPVAAPTPDPKPVVAPPPSAPETVSVIVDTEPPKAKILKDGAQIGETPEEVKVPAGGTVKVVLKKDGYVEEPVLVDPSKGHKVLIKLDKEHSGQKPSAKRAPKIPVYSSPGPIASPVKLPAPPPIPPPPVATPAPAPVRPAPVVVPPPPPARRKPATPDPYERLDDAPSKPKKSGDVLNPY